MLQVQDKPTEKGGDPLYWCLVIAAAFFLAALVRINFPAGRMFDEKFYIPAAARLLLGIDVINREHPMLAKELMAVALALFGNQPFGWRIGSVVAGALGLFAAMRAMWWYSGSRHATILFGILLATQGLLFALARMAMLDVYMFAFAAWAVMLFSQRSFAASGAAFGLALACKWSIVPILAMFGLISLAQQRSWRTVLWFGAIPLCVYFLTFLPGFLVAERPFTLASLLPMQLEMAQHLALPMRPHPYGSQWWHWVLNIMPVWMIHNEIEGPYRHVMIAGNPVSSLLIPVAVAVALWRRGLPSAPAQIYLACIAFWAASGKAVQFYYHYLLAAAFGLAALALLIAGRKLAYPLFILIFSAFIWLFPALTGAPTSRDSAAQYTRLPGWQFRETPVTPILK